MIFYAKTRFRQNQFCFFVVIQKRIAVDTRNYHQMIIIEFPVHNIFKIILTFFNYLNILIS